MSGSYLELQHLTKRYDEHVAVDDLSLTVPRGGVLALLGPSGSGKTTTLRLLAGFERPDAGRIVVEGRDVTGLSAAQRRFGMVFQHYALFPHLTVAENVAFGLAGSARGPTRVAATLGLVDLTGFEHRGVTELSGGQQQRVALARALAPEPAVLLLDEPLSNLDPGLRERTRRELRTVLRETGVTTLLVTHEQEEAFALGERVAVLRAGRLEQVGTPRELYEQPRTLFVATFVGRASVLPGVMAGADRVRLEGGVEWPATSPTSMRAGETVTVVVRPESLRFGADGLIGDVAECRYTGARSFYLVRLGERTIEVEGAADAARLGDRVRLTATRAHVFPGGAA
jgi:ABC-type Fe3+/spermidine/putrescine transport system ATPase subunit